MHCILKHCIMIVHWLCIQYNTENLIRRQSSVARLNGSNIATHNWELSFDGDEHDHVGICMFIEWWNTMTLIQRMVLVLDDNQLRIDLNWLNVAAVVSSRVHLGEQPYEVGWMQFPAPEVIISASQHGSLPNKVHQLLSTGCIFSCEGLQKCHYSASQ